MGESIGLWSVYRVIQSTLFLSALDALHNNIAALGRNPRQLTQPPSQQSDRPSKLPDLALLLFNAPLDVGQNLHRRPCLRDVLFDTVHLRREVLELEGWAAGLEVLRRLLLLLCRTRLGLRLLLGLRRGFGLRGTRLCRGLLEDIQARDQEVDVG